jgi:hypothetical protein
MKGPLRGPLPPLQPDVDSDDDDDDDNWGRYRGVAVVTTRKS